MPAIYPIEYDREDNINTPAYWNGARRCNRNKTPKSVKVARRVAEILEGKVTVRVQEYGFGSTHLAMMIGPDRWEGFDFSEEAVSTATQEGFTASLQRCKDANPSIRSCVVAIEVLEHLDRDEMVAFLNAARQAELVLLSVPKAMKRDEDFAPHMRTFGLAMDFAAFLRCFWKSVEVERVGLHWLLAACSENE